MNVTFFENQSFYPKTHIQGQSSIILEECQFWQDEDITTMPTLPTLSTPTITIILLAPLPHDSPSKIGQTEATPSTPQIPTQRAENKDVLNTKFLILGLMKGCLLVTVPSPQTCPIWRIRPAYKKYLRNQSGKKSLVKKFESL